MDQIMMHQERESIACIMQPTFLPWLGYFSLIFQSNDFVFLDDVQLVKRSWQVRNSISGPNGPVLLSLPVDGKVSRPKLCEAELAQHDFRPDLMARIVGSIVGAPNAKLVTDLVERAFDCCFGSLAELNIGFIESVSQKLGFYPRFHRSSSFGFGEIEKVDRLFAICEVVHASTYLSPVGSSGYLQNQTVFKEDGIRLRYLNFTPLPYKQRKGEFQSLMSIIDALAWCGIDETRRLIVEGTKTPLIEAPASKESDDDQ